MTDTLQEKVLSDPDFTPTVSIQEISTLYKGDHSPSNVHPNTNNYKN